ncbi:ATP-binding protein involved in chromosome partitioning [Fluviicoccus keumensis]|uniref:Iron-sulfur cluster carrier protein n=1 Tax=Fluviicoccus keumensis TaxID=1435465 RepID=A0A4Q7Z5M3_9GAMM|nr:iron-sulfur cluster carrier protein ApbC [Fluviicoccus keumensis]RZU45324.1 ATP-binding protein involved in chromosome partitioning [Fluviicoccus keumensis]
MSLSRKHLESALSRQVDPWMGKDLLALTERMDIDGDLVSIQLALPYPFASCAGELRDLLVQTLTDAGAGRVAYDLILKVPRSKPTNNVESAPPIKNVIVVASGKGGVGKSTTAVNIALALAAEGARVGILDADIYGPSIPTMLGLFNQRPEIRNEAFVPLQAYGLQAMSIGFLIDDNNPVVWRGPKVTGALLQLFGQTAWQDLDYLVIDMPPGTGDIQLTLAQRIPVSGAVVVSTPQDIALLDAKKGIEMFRKVNIDVLGVVENMALHVCSNCGHTEAIFGEGGGERIAREYQTELLGQLPLNKSIREQADSGKPTVVAQPDGPLTAHYRHIARRIAVKLAQHEVVPTNRIGFFSPK